MSVNERLPWVKISFGVCVGTLVGAVALWQLGATDPEVNSGAQESKPLYWVAPMDPNYRRDQPGKSPMGMDLIPVFEQTQSASPGVVQIDSAVVNNLGVRTARVQVGKLATQIETVGHVQFDENQLIHIHPRVDGWIEQLMVKSTGDRVVAGEPLYAMYSPTLVNAQEELLLAIERKNRVLINAALDRLAALQVPEAAIARLQETQQVTRTVTITAPQTGVVNDLLIREGMFVKPGVELMSIAGLNQVWVIGEVFESQVSQVQQGNSVTVRLDYLPGRVWQSRVDYIYPVLNPATRTLSVRVRLDNADLALRPGMFADMAIATQDAVATLVVPSEAVIRTGHQDRVVLALGAGRFKSVAVKLGAVSANQIEILSGLSEGDLIVTSAQFLIDSESSKASDFKRMATTTADKMSMDDARQGHAMSMPMDNAGTSHKMPMDDAHQGHQMPVNDPPQDHSRSMGDGHNGHQMPRRDTHQDHQMPVENLHQDHARSMGDAHDGHHMPTDNAHQPPSMPMSDAHQGHEMPASSPLDDTHQGHEMNMPDPVADPHDGHHGSAKMTKQSGSSETFQ
ncbi:MAG: efflux RND transporter periplasmic adaptor subunit [Litorivicinaceae bacterium]|nr:efflux RND transporter periplasmic adaptor subunit [Litorivicinaceae bacterium]